VWTSQSGFLKSQPAPKNNSLHYTLQCNNRSEHVYARESNKLDALKCQIQFAASTCVIVIHLEINTQYLSCLCRCQPGHPIIYIDLTIWKYVDHWITEHLSFNGQPTIQQTTFLKYISTIINVGNNLSIYLLS